jgi:hypothetical protein
MAWTNLVNALFLPGKKILGSTGMALRDNAISIAEGDINAPKVRGSAVLLARSFLNITGTAQAGWTDLDRVKVMRFDFSQTTGAVGADIQFRFSTNGGSSWSAYQAITTLASATNSTAVGTLWLDLPSGDFQLFGFRATTAPGSPVFINSNGTVTSLGAGVNGLQFRNSAATTPTLQIRGHIVEGVSP